MAQKTKATKRRMDANTYPAHVENRKTRRQYRRNKAAARRAGIASAIANGFTRSAARRAF